MARRWKVTTTKAKPKRTKTRRSGILGVLSIDRFTDILGRKQRTVTRHKTRQVRRVGRAQTGFKRWWT